MRKLMKSLLLLLISSLLCHPLIAEPASKSEPTGLRLTAHKSYTILSPAVSEGQPTTGFPIYRRQISVYLENCGDKPITVPTNPDHIGGSRAQNLRNTFYGFFMEERNKRPIMVSPFKYQPVTLAPGEITELPIYIDKATITDVATEKPIQDSVTFHVSDDLAKRHGWWSGSLSVPTTKESLD